MGLGVDVGDAAATTEGLRLGVALAPPAWTTTTRATAATRNAMPSRASAIGRLEPRDGGTGTGAPQEARVS